MLVQMVSELVMYSICLHIKVPQQINWFFVSTNWWNHWKNNASMNGTRQYRTWSKNMSATEIAFGSENTHSRHDCKLPLVQQALLDTTDGCQNTSLKNRRSRRFWMYSVLSKRACFDQDNQFALYKWSLSQWLLHFNQLVKPRKKQHLSRQTRPVSQPRSQLGKLSSKESRQHSCYGTRRASQCRPSFECAKETFEEEEEEESETGDENDRIWCGSSYELTFWSSTSKQF